MLMVIHRVETESNISDLIANLSDLLILITEFANALWFHFKFNQIQWNLVPNCCPAAKQCTVCSVCSCVVSNICGPCVRLDKSINYRLEVAQWV